MEIAKFKENWLTKPFFWRIAEKNKGRYYWFTSCKHCHFKKDGNRHQNRSCKSKWSRYYSIDILRFTTTSPPPPHPSFVFKCLYVVNNYTDCRNCSIISRATKIFADDLIQIFKHFHSYDNCTLLENFRPQNRPSIKHDGGMEST